jgi:ATP-dependent helicase HrpB
MGRIRAEARRLARLAPAGGPTSPGEAASHAYPDRIGLRRPGDDPRWLLSGGKGAAMDPGDALAGQRLLVACDTGGGREARIRLAAALTESELRAAHGGRIAWHEVCEWSRRERRVVARLEERLGAVVLAERLWRDAPSDALARAALDGMRNLGLPTSPGAERLRGRVAWARRAGARLPDLSEEALLADLAWLEPHMAGVRTAADLAALDPRSALEALLGWDGMRTLDRLVPEAVEVPSGRRVPVSYGEAPDIAVRLQEMLGATAHPVAAGEPIRVTLLSPAGRPIQVTTDLPGFWSGAYVEVRKEMRGRYPKHDWPEDPAGARPSTGARRRR